jgi:dihydroneopterin aldolase
VDVYIDCDFSDAAFSDNLSETIDYCAVYEICKKEMQVRSNLIEQVGQRIFNALKDEFNQIINLKVKLTKLKPPIPGDVNQVSVEVED